MSGKLEHELELDVPESDAWDLFGRLRIGQLVEKEMPSLFQKVELVEGDVGVGTIQKLTFAPGTPGLSFLKEKFTKVDDDGDRIKETEVVEGGYLELGFALSRVRLEVIEKGEESSIIKSTLEYELKEDALANAPLASNAIQSLANIFEMAKAHLSINKLTNQPN